MHGTGDLGEYRNRNRISELPVGLCVGDRNAEAVLISHEAGAFPWGEPAWTLAFAATDKNLRTILVVASRKRPGDTVTVDQTKAETVALCTVFGGISLQIGPELVREEIGRRRVGKEC